MNKFIEMLNEKLIKNRQLGRKSLEAVLEDIKQAEAEYKGGWIPVSERLPNEEEMKRAYRRNKYGSEFIVMIDGATEPTTLYRTLKGVWVDDHRQVYKVTAWQPLPEPYKEGGVI